MNRAVAIEAGDIGGPNHGISGPVGDLRQRLPERGPPRGPAGEHLVAGQRGELVGARVDEAVRVRDRAEHDLVPGGLVVVAAERVRGQHGDLVGPEQVRDLGGDGPALGGGVPLPAVLAQAVDGRAELVALGRRGRRAGSSGGRSCGAASRASSRVRAHWSRIRARRRASSVMVPARPSPRTRSRVACTSSRTPGRDSSAPSSSTVSRCVSRPTRCSSGATAASSVSSVRAATQSSSAAVKTGEVKWSPSICRTARVRLGPVGSCAGSGGELGAPHLGQVLDRGDDQVVLGREVVQLRAPADPGPLADQRRRRTAEAALDQQLDGGLHQPRPHRPGALLLGNARGGLGHPFRMGSRVTNSQD